MPPRLYCGNNAHHADLMNGTAVIGTRRGCLEKGKFVGLAQPPDPAFLQPYVPIDDTRKYCGNHDHMPPGYDRFGGLYECFLKGVGVGKRQRAVGGGGGLPPPAAGGARQGFGAKKWWMIATLLCLLLILWRPAFLETDDPPETRQQDLWKYTIAFLILYLVLFLTISHI